LHLSIQLLHHKYTTKETNLHLKTQGSGLFELNRTK